MQMLQTDSKLLPLSQIPNILTFKFARELIPKIKQCFFLLLEVFSKYILQRVSEIYQVSQGVHSYFALQQEFFSSFWGTALLILIRTSFQRRYNYSRCHQETKVALNFISLFDILSSLNGFMGQTNLASSVLCTSGLKSEPCIAIMYLRGQEA